MTKPSPREVQLRNRTIIISTNAVEDLDRPIVEDEVESPRSHHSEQYQEEESRMNNNNNNVNNNVLPNNGGGNNVVRSTLRQQTCSTDWSAGPSCIRFPEPQEDKQDIELKSGFLHRLPIFQGMAHEDPNMHLRQFQFVCSSMKPTDADDELLKLKAFPFTLKDRAQTWLMELPPNHITTWKQLTDAFLSKYFPASKITVLRKKITGITQASDESFGQYYDRFKVLCATCPSHGFSETNLMNYFYDGLKPIDRELLDAAANGAFMDLDEVGARALLENRANNDAQYGMVPRKSVVSEVSTKHATDEKYNRLLDLMEQMLELEVKRAKVSLGQLCGICHSHDHHGSQCPTLVEQTSEEQVNAIGGYQGGQRYNNYNNNYVNRDHPGFK